MNKKELKIEAIAKAYLKLLKSIGRVYKQGFKIDLIFTLILLIFCITN